LPLVEKVVFRAMLQRGNRVQIPRLMRWRFKLEQVQILKVTVHCLNLWSFHQTFYARMGKDGRIVIPKLIIVLMKNDKPSIEGYIIEVTLEPS
jgi:bifunctional DNA-binding transcriptional regulator/antitoxin component of YhaV-PrlF toxin-antitoxin module